MFMWFTKLGITAQYRRYPFRACGETLQLGINDVLGGNATPWAPVSFIDTLFITTASGALCTKDGRDDEWGIVSQEERDSLNWSHIYFFGLRTATLAPFQVADGSAPLSISLSESIPMRMCSST